MNAASGVARSLSRVDFLKREAQSTSRLVCDSGEGGITHRIDWSLLAQFNSFNRSHSRVDHEPMNVTPGSAGSFVDVGRLRHVDMGHEPWPCWLERGGPSRLTQPVNRDIGCPSMLFPSRCQHPLVLRYPTRPFRKPIEFSRGGLSVWSFICRWSPRDGGWCFLLGVDTGTVLGVRRQYKCGHFTIFYCFLTSSFYIIHVHYQ